MDRIPLDDLTSDQLDDLYALLDVRRTIIRSNITKFRSWARRIRDLEAENAELRQQLADADQADDHTDQTCEAVTGRDAAEARIDRIRDAARLHRQTLISTSELYAVIEALDPQPTTLTHPGRPDPDRV